VKISYPSITYTRYLYYGRLAVLIQDTLFVHGAIQEKVLGYVPPWTSASASILDTNNTAVNMSIRKSEVYTDGRTEQINAFAASEIEAYRCVCDQVSERICMCVV
jgi:hypothetical protein